MGVSKLLEGEGEELGERRGVEGACEEDGQGTVEITFFSPTRKMLLPRQVLSESFQSQGSESCTPGVCSGALDKALFFRFKKYVFFLI